MRKISLLFLIISVLALTASPVSAERYNSLRFISNSGETYTIATNNLEILISGENLTFSNTDLIIPLASLVSMEFADYNDNPAQIDEMVFDRNSTVMVYDLNGTQVGSFDSYSEALGSLATGLYVIKDANGNSFKVNVEK